MPCPTTTWTMSNINLNTSQPLATSQSFTSHSKELVSNLDSGVDSNSHCFKRLQIRYFLFAKSCTVLHSQLNCFCINMKPEARYWSFLVELVEILRVMKGIDARVRQQWKKELFFSELDYFNPEPPRTYEGAYQRMIASCPSWTPDVSDDPIPNAPHVPDVQKTKFLLCYMSLI